MSNHHALSIKAINASTFKIEVTEESVEHRNLLIACAREIAVYDQESVTKATEAASNLRKLSKNVESLRVELKAPLLAAGKQLDELARTYCAPLLRSIHETEDRIATFVVEERRKEDAARRAREAEEQAERDRLAEIERQKAAAIREEQEAALRAEQAKGKAARERAEQEALEARRARQQAEIDAHEAQRDIEERQRSITVASSPVLKTTGLTIRKHYEIKVVDAEALLKSFPHLVELVPRTGLIRGIIENSEGKTELPGVTVTITDRAASRV